jgi:uncharacterized protein YndB with AHSA1/START domain
MSRVVLTHTFSAAPAKVFAYLSEHENLAPILGAKITRDRDGDDGQRNGVGSRRTLKIGPLPSFDETNVEVIPDELIRYRITRGSPLRGHEGIMRFTPTASGGCTFSWVITFEAVAPGIAPIVALGLTRSITKALPKIEAKL